MYQVIELFGEYEPWWFFEDWRDDIYLEVSYATSQEAVEAYEALYQSYATKYENVQTKKQWLTAFWNEAEVRYCEDCEDDVQLYHSILLLENNQPIQEQVEEKKESS
ncbi:DUF1033 family protein [Isobaculum melis]|uniref:DUF1033 domain-containing protein n=1 Tax=Isobaculum melis TaxID=142588 RepID=A0A1H9UGB8_9LACT|nr:DUF1033 family protein [Isobaculum melis]SES08580.1 hypothetical protein SAMN04488559_1306 [Isobaculum melis]